MQSFEILKEARIQFDFEAAGGTGRTVVRLADLLGGTDVEFEHVGLAVGGKVVVDGGGGRESVFVVGRSLCVTALISPTPLGP